MKAAFQGRPGAYSELAAQRMLPGGFEALPCDEFADVVVALIDNIAEFAVLPVHNTLAGVISATCRLIAESPLRVEQECSMRIAHSLIGISGTRLESIREIRSHPVALAQCRAFFQEYPHISAVPTLDTAGAVEEIIASGRDDVAAIAGEHAAGRHAVTILRRGIEDCRDNFTTFMLLRST